MRPLLLFMLLFVTIHAYGQEPATNWPDSLFTVPDWLETSGGEREGYVLTMTADGNFEEDAGEQHNRPYRYLMGRWTVDTAAQTLTLAVDGQMGKTGVHRRYLKGRDFYLVYAIASFENGALTLKDRLTGAVRTFKATEHREYVEPAMRRLPKPGKQKGGFKLPEGWGGLDR